jgi:hypothetical protein
MPVRSKITTRIFADQPAHPQALANLAIAETLRQQPQDAPFLRGQFNSGLRFQNSRAKQILRTWPEAGASIPNLR